MSITKTLSVVIPVFNKFNFTKSCLNDLSKLPNDHEIIIVDNGSSDETESMLNGNKDIVYVRQNNNLGFATGCNIGYSMSSATNILFLNNDIRVKSDYNNWTKQLIDNCDKGLVGPTMGQLDNNLNFVREANSVLSGKSYMSGWCLASSRKIWNQLAIAPIESEYLQIDYVNPPAPRRWQIFSEEFGLAYFEDTDLSFRARKLGIKMQVVDIPLVHFGKQTSKQLNTHQLYTNARQIFVKKWQNQ